MKPIEKHGRSFFAFGCVLFFALLAAFATFVEAAFLPELDIKFILDAGEMVMFAGVTFIGGNFARDAFQNWRSTRPAPVSETTVKVEGGEAKVQVQTPPNDDGF